MVTPIIESLIFMEGDMIGMISGTLFCYGTSRMRLSETEFQIIYFIKYFQKQTSSVILLAVVSHSRLSSHCLVPQSALHVH